MHKPVRIIVGTRCVAFPVAIVLIWVCCHPNCARPETVSDLAEQGSSSPSERIQHVDFHSASFETRKKYCVVLPANYTAEKADWPMLCILHGRGRNERSLIDNTVTRDALLAASFVTLLPSGEDGWYLDSPVNDKNKYEQLLDETLVAAETKYRLSRDPKKRGIAGWSMGGYGSVRYAENHPDHFAMVASIIGLLDFPRSDLPEGQSYQVPVKIFGNNEATWHKLNPLNSTERLRNMSVVLIAADRAFDRTMNETFRNRLQQQDIKHDWLMLSGTHHFDLVKEAIPVVLQRFEEKLKATQNRPATMP